MHDLGDGRERKATEEESKVYSLPENVQTKKLFSEEEIEGQASCAPRFPVMDRMWCTSAL
jgi:hypothetical protein